MTNEEREELIEKMAHVIGGMSCWHRDTPEIVARAALAVAEPVIREDCAEIADREANPNFFETSDFLDGIAFGARVIAKAIREGGKK